MIIFSTTEFSIVPQKEIVMKITESKPSPTTVDRIVLSQRFLPLVMTFSFDRMMELENSPKR